MRSFRLLTLLQVLAIVSTVDLTFLNWLLLIFLFCAIDGDTTCFRGIVATCVNGQFDTSQGLCPAKEQCFAIPSTTSDGTVSQTPNNYFSARNIWSIIYLLFPSQTITCTSEKIALSLIEAAGATGGITGSGSSGSSINSTSTSSTSSGDTSTATSTDSSTTPTSTSLDDSVVTVTVTTLVLASSTSPPSVTQTLSPEEASSLLSSLLGQGGPTTTATSDGSETPSPTDSATATDSGSTPTATPDPNNLNGVPSSTTPTPATDTPSSASPDASGTPVDIANATASPTGLGSDSGGYSGY